MQQEKNMTVQSAEMNQLYCQVIIIGDVCVYVGWLVGGR